jgi:hypothetical protein
MPKEGHWHALRVRRGFDLITADRLREEGFNVYVPRLGGPEKDPAVLFLRGHVFCRFRLADLPSVLSTTGVSLVVGHPMPSLVDVGELTLIQKIERSGVFLRSVPMREGSRRVRLTAGPLKGVEGYLVERHSKKFLVINLKCVRRAISIEIDGWPMEPVRNDIRAS